MSLAVVFPGQGSQSPGMLAELADAYGIVGETFAEASDVLGEDYWSMAQNASAEALADTRVTQPLMYISGVAVWRVLQSADLPKPVALAGHSLGEFAAMTASGSLAYRDGLSLVARRAELMSTAVPEGEGGMAALIGMADSDVQSLCQEVTGERVVEAVNFNAPGQVAISGHHDAIEKAAALARERGARKAMVLPVSVPNHSSLMREAGARLAERIDAFDWQPNEVPVLQNATAEAASSLDAALDCLRQHVFSPVHWTDTVLALRDRYGVTAVIEAGPGRVLTGLGKRIDRQLKHFPVDSPSSLESALEALGT